jgi:hypothetical protein
MPSVLVQGGRKSRDIAFEGEFPASLHEITAR